MEFKRNHADIILDSVHDEPETFDQTTAKRRINELLFEWMPPNTTLRELEHLACAIFKTVEDAWMRPTDVPAKVNG